VDFGNSFTLTISTSGSEIIPILHFIWVEMGKYLRISDKSTPKGEVLSNLLSEDVLRCPTIENQAKQLNGNYAYSID
jgi:hypothetical protein